MSSRGSARAHTRGFCSHTNPSVGSSRLGDILLRTGLVTEEELQEALARQKGTTKLLGEVLIQLGYLVPSQLEEALCLQLAERPQERDGA